MTRSFNKTFAVGLLMVCAAILTKVATPNIFMSATRTHQTLSDLIPHQFGAWKEEKDFNSIVVSPQQEALISEIYTQTISRTYTNQIGDKIMLSIAYGADQRDQKAVHYPEVCYPAQGFQITSDHRSVVITKSGNIPVKRLETNLQKRRYEPVTYWAIVGNKITRGPLDKKLTEIKFGLSGQIPDGLIFRVSSIDSNVTRAFSLQNQFIISLEENLTLDNKKRLMGIN